jgi:hypothetical protein
MVRAVDFQMDMHLSRVSPGVVSKRRSPRLRAIPDANLLAGVSAAQYWQEYY